MLFASRVYQSFDSLAVDSDGNICIATLVTGGTLVNPQTQKSGEIRGTSISGGERHPVQAGDIIHIPAGVPHQLVVEKGPFEYFVVKVTGQ